MWMNQHGLLWMTFFESRVLKDNMGKKNGPAVEGVEGCGSECSGHG
jgi:hypothetical protein